MRLNYGYEYNKLRFGNPKMRRMRRNVGRDAAMHAMLAMLWYCGAARCCGAAMIYHAAATTCTYHLRLKNRADQRSESKESKSTALSR